MAILNTINMKNTLLLLLIILIGCEPSHKKQTSQDTKQSNILKTDTLNFTIPTTALPIEPLRIFPLSFTLDSIFKEDTVFNYSTKIYFPKSKDNVELNQLIKQFIEHQISIEKQKNITNNGTSFEMWITDLKVSTNLIHCLFRQQTFTQGAAHFNHAYSTLNYDPIKRKKVLFTDIFKFSKDQSKQSFCNKINGYINGIDDSDGYNDGLTPQDIDENLNYEVWKQQLIVYPNYCCANEHKIFTIELRLIQDYINPTFRKTYGLIISSL